MLEKIYLNGGENMQASCFDYIMHGSMNYYLYIPDDFDKAERFPMIVFLHGAGERGDDIEELKRQALPKYISQGEKYRAVILMPQCPEGYVWNNLTVPLMDLILKTADEYGIDLNRISLTGISMGGFGTWEMGMVYPGFFSALAPVCGGGIAWRAASLVNTPIRAFHGACDDTVMPSLSLEMVSAVNNCGGSATLTVFPTDSHNSWDSAYKTTDVITWLTDSKKQ